MIGMTLEEFYDVWLTLQDVLPQENMHTRIGADYGVADGIYSLVQPGGVRFHTISPLRDGSDNHLQVVLRWENTQGYYEVNRVRPGGFGYERSGYHAIGNHGNAAVFATRVVLFPQDVRSGAVNI